MPDPCRAALAEELLNEEAPRATASRWRQRAVFAVCSVLGLVVGSIGLNGHGNSQHLEDGITMAGQSMHLARASQQLVPTRASRLLGQPATGQQLVHLGVPRLDARQVFMPRAVFRSEGTSSRYVGEAPPQTIRQAIDQGIKRYNEGDYDEAMKLFDKGLTLPGTGVKRYTDKPPLPSDEEKAAVYYNKACCYSGKAKLAKGTDKELEYCNKGLSSLNDAIKEGFDGWDTIMADPDLQSLRDDARDPGFEKLRDFYAPKGVEAVLGYTAIKESRIGQFLKLK